MGSQESPKHHRFRRWLNQNENERPRSPSGLASPLESTDRKRTRERYIEATKLLHDAVNISKDEWGVFALPDLKGELEGFNSSQFKERLDAVLETKMEAQKNRTSWEQCSYAMQCCFIAFSPFAKNFLSIATNAQSIPILNPYGLICGGLMVLITMAERELKRKKGLLDTMEFISQQFAQLSVLSVLPGDIEERELIVNRALDVRSAAMIHLAISIRYESTRLGSLGNILKVIFTGDEDITDSKTYLNSCIQAYSTALTSIMLVRTHIKVSDILKGIEALNLRQEQKLLENRHLIPYEKNPKLTGREAFLESLKEQLYMEQPGDFNHRVALFGMGGIGKTQCALGYVYVNEAIYDRIYWITAVDNTSLLSGYQNIAREARLAGCDGANPVETAKTVIQWLHQEKSWLLIIDNLDDITIINNLLPANGPAQNVTQHTLITTRNPDTIGIPAKPLEVPLLESDDAISLLSKISGISLEADPDEREQAGKVAEILGHLPLALEQAAAYIREVEGNFKSYYNKYLQDHKVLHEWRAGGNRQYQYIVATAWAISFKVVAENNPSAARLLQLFAFLNPDGIMIEFLVAGARGLDKSLNETVLDENKLAKALLELAKMSIVKWDRRKKLISMHRLIQKVVADYMPSTVSEINPTSNDDPKKKSISIHRLIQKVIAGGKRPNTSDTKPTFSLTSIIGLCDYAFPEGIEPRSLYRKYLSQVVEPLLRLSTVRTEKAALVKGRVAHFLHHDGKYADSLKLFLQTLEISREILNRNMELQAMHNIIQILSDIGRHEESAKIGEEAVTKSKSALGKDHKMTLRIMGSLALSYNSLGRLQEAASIAEDWVETSVKQFGPNDFETIDAMHHLAIIYNSQGRHDEALKLRAQILEKSKFLRGDMDVWTLAAMHHLALTYYRLKCYPEAEKLQEESLVLHKKVLGDDHPRTVLAMECLVDTYCCQNRYNEALPLKETALRRMRLEWGDLNNNTLRCMQELAQMYESVGRSMDASGLREEIKRNSSSEEQI